MSGWLLRGGLPGSWLDELFGRLAEEGQGVRDLIRRSAGIPFGFMAVFLAEPNGMPRTLLHSALGKLLDIAVRIARFFFFALHSLFFHFFFSFALIFLSVASLYRFLSSYVVVALR